MAKGYWQNRNLTESKFLSIPLVSNKLLYKTGDICVRLENGEFDIIGRVDNQVKYRGYRIELGEIEEVIRRVTGIDDICVVLAPVSANTVLKAFLMTTLEINFKKLTEEISNYLPDYMIPSFFVCLEKFPLMVSGKIDRISLADYEIHSLSVVDSDFSNDTERQVSDIWCNTIGITPHKHDNFFHSGGNSLLGTMFISQINKFFKTSFPLSLVFKYPTVCLLSEFIMNNNQQSYEPIPVFNKDKLFLSPAQVRLYFISQFNQVGVAYNWVFVRKYEGNLDVSKLEKAFENLLRNHSILRTSYHQTENELYQKVHVDVGLNFEFIESGDEIIYLY